MALCVYFCRPAEELPAHPLAAQAAAAARPHEAAPVPALAAALAGRQRRLGLRARGERRAGRLPAARGCVAARWLPILRSAGAGRDMTQSPCLLQEGSEAGRAPPPLDATRDPLSPSASLVSQVSRESQGSVDTETTIPAGRLVLAPMAQAELLPALANAPVLVLASSFEKGALLVAGV